MKALYAPPWVSSGEIHKPPLPLSNFDENVADCPFASDLADTFPNGEFVDYFRASWITQLIKETRANRDYSARTIETARWARAQVKKQTEAGQGGGQIMT